MIRFNLFGIPVTIEPWFWLSAFALGGGLHLQASSGRSDIAEIVLWMMVACLSILVHEFGHALTARKLSGGRNWIKLWAMGGLAYHEGGRPTRKHRLWTIFMGPGAGFLLFLATCVAIVAIYGVDLGPRFIKALVFKEELLDADIYTIYENQHAAWGLFSALVWLNFWWSLVNLLPVHPLDGGQFYATWTGKTRETHQLGAIVGTLTALVAILFYKDWFVTILFGYLAYQNYSQLQKSQGGGSWR